MNTVSVLDHEAKLIAQGQQEFVRDFAALWAHFVTRLRFKAKVPATDARHR